MNNLVAAYKGLTEKDRRALQLLAVVFSLFLLVQLIILPSLNFYTGAKSRYVDNQQLLTWMENNAGRARQAGQNNITPQQNDITLLEAVSQSATRAKLDISRIQPEGDDLARVWFNAASFDSFIPWLYSLTTSRSLAIDSISIDRTDQPGIVDIQLSLSK